MRTNYAATVLLILISFQVTQAVEASEAFAIMVKAYQSSGFSPSTIRSGVAEFERVTELHNNPSARSEEIHHKREEIIKEQYKGDEVRIARELERIRDSYEESRRKLIQERLKILMSGNDSTYGGEPGDKYKRRFEKYEWIPNLGQNIPVGIDLNFGTHVRDENASKSQLYVHWVPNNRDLVVYDRSVSWAEFQEFGRFRHTPDSYVAAIIRHKIDRTTFELPADFYEFADSKIKEFGLSINVTDEIDYDNGAKATVIEVKRGNRLLEKYHIDVNRGYLCPYQYVATDSGDYFNERTAKDYIVEENSGLYYPSSYREVISRSGGADKTDMHYRLVPDTLRLNHTVSDHEFAIDIPVDARVADFRIIDKPVRYIAVNKGTVSLAKGGYDFANMKWLQREYSPEDYIPSTGGMTGWTRWVFTGIGIILILLALRRLLWKKVH